MPTIRRALPSTVREEVLREAGYKCGNPTCRNILTLQLHHMLWVRDGGQNIATNLLALCGHCHDMHTHGHIPAAAIAHWKGLLHALNHAFNNESMDLLLYLARPEIDVIWYSGDGTLRFAGLIAAGLVDILESQFAIGVRYGANSPPTNPPSTALRLGLSMRGRSLVNSWLTGDEGAYLRYISGNNGDQSAPFQETL